MFMKDDRNRIVHLLRKPLDVPSTQSLYVFDDQLETRKVQGSDGIESYVEQHEGPFKERVDRVRWAVSEPSDRSNRRFLTARDFMNLVLNKEVHKWHDRPKEARSQDLSPLDAGRIWRAECKASHCPRNRCDQIADHEDVMPVVVISGGDIGPSAARQCSEDSHACNHLREGCIWACGKTVP